MLPKAAKQRLLSIAGEDIAGLDITTSLLDERTTFAKIKANQSCVLSGVEEAVFLFKHFGVKTVFAKSDGLRVSRGQTVLKVFGSNRKILAIERTSLNVLGRMSGVATICAKAKNIAGKKTKIFLTRKTMPGFNLFDKKACLHSGVFPHRTNLRESFLIKGNHLAFESIPQLLKKAKQKKKKFRAKEIEIEVSNIGEAILAAKNGAQVIMLDNFSAKRAAKAVKEIKRINKKVKIELSGGITFKNLRAYLNFGADRISMGQLTKEAKIIDFSLGVE